MQQKVAYNNRKCEAALIESTLQACALHIMSCLQVNCSAVQHTNKDWCCDCASGRSHSTKSSLLLKKGSPCVLSPACPGWKRVRENSSPKPRGPPGPKEIRLCHPAWLLSLLSIEVLSWSRAPAASAHPQCNPFSSPKKAYRHTFGILQLMAGVLKLCQFYFCKNRHLQALGQQLWLCWCRVVRAKSGEQGASCSEDVPRGLQANPAWLCWGARICTGLKESEGRGFIRWDG